MNKEEKEEVEFILNFLKTDGTVFLTDIQKIEEYINKLEQENEKLKQQNEEISTTKRKLIYKMRGQMF